VIDRWHQPLVQLAPELGHDAPMMVNGRLTSAPTGIVASILDRHAAPIWVEDFYYVVRDANGPALAYI
jgi:hypothetical protein